MSVYIPGMEMPVTCCHCPLMGYDPDREWYDSMARTGAHICVLTGELIDNAKREEHCPLIPVPEHGDLIDKSGVDVLSWTEDPEKDFADGVLFVLDKLDELPVIIPADKEGEG